VSHDVDLAEVLAVRHELQLSLERFRDRTHGVEAAGLMACLLHWLGIERAYHEQEQRWAAVPDAIAQATAAVRVFLDAGLDVKTARILAFNGRYRTVSDVRDASDDDLLALRYLGRVTLAEIRRVLK
jgi:hypothetical protein